MELKSRHYVILLVLGLVLIILSQTQYTNHPNLGRHLSMGVGIVLTVMGGVVAFRVIMAGTPATSSSSSSAEASSPLLSRLGGRRRRSSVSLSSDDVYDAGKN